ncbi:MAG: DnaB-like helicase C-terminal domain-containing protein [Pseudomonadota bacterium]
MTSRTGFSTLDNALSDLHLGELRILETIPHKNKCTLSPSSVINTCIMENRSVFLASLNNDKVRLVEDIICNQAGINIKNYNLGHLNKRAWKKLARASGQLSSANIFIDDRLRAVADIIATAKKLKAEKNIELIIITSLKLIRTSQDFNNRNEEDTTIVHALKTLAEELKLQIIILSP